MIQLVCFLLLLSVYSLSFFPALPMEESREILYSPAYSANANHGHIEEMAYIIERHLESGGYLDSKEDLAQQLDTIKRNEHFKTAVEWFARYYIRVRQDAACYDDPKAVADRVEDYLEKQPFAQAISSNISKQELNKIYLEQLPWVEQITEDPFFPAPVIGFYLTDPYDLHPDDKSIILRNYPIPQHPSQEKRQNALLEFKQWLTWVTQE